MKKEKKRIYGIERKILCVALVLSMGIGILEPGKLLAFTFEGDQPFKEKFEEVLSTDKTTSTIKLSIPKNNQQVIDSITLPDQKKIIKEEFQTIEDQYSFEYVATENKEYEYVVEYQEYEEAQPEAGVGLPEKITPVEPKLSELKKVTLSYRVNDIKLKEEMELSIQAKDLSFKQGDKINLTKDITIMDEENKDISNALNINILNYDGYSEGKMGEFELEYMVQHPVSLKEYTFTRTVTIEKPEKKVANEKAESTTKATIKLSDGNATLKRPSDFEIGHKTQENFNISIYYSSQPLDNNRTLKITIPKGFRLNKELSKDDVQSASSITTTGNANEESGTVIIINFIDGINLDASFELNIRQMESDLYLAANVSEHNYEFKTEAYKNGTVLAESDKFTFHTDKLLDNKTSAPVVIKDKLEGEVKYYFDDGVNGQGFIRFEDIIIVKPKYSNLDEIRYRIPKFFNDMPVVHKGNTSDSSLILETEEYYEYSLSNNSDFMYSYTDREINIGSFQYNFDTGMQNHPIDVVTDAAPNPYDNGIFESSSELGLVGRGQFEKIVIDTKTSNFPNIKDESTFSEKNLLIGANTSDYVGNAFQFSMDDQNNYHHKNVKVKMHFPYELQPTSINFEKGIAYKTKIYTNLSNQYEISTSERGGKNYPWIYAGSDLNNLSVLLGEDEYITSLEMEGALTGPQSIYVDFNVKENDIDGKPIQNGQEVEITTTIEDQNLDKTNKSTKVELIKRDGLEFIPSESTKDNIAIGSLSTGAMIDVRWRSSEASSYVNPEWIFEGKEVLSLIDTIKTSQGGTAIYSTNLNKQEIEMSLENGWAGKLIPLSEGEYLTKLKITMDQYVIRESGYSNIILSSKREIPKNLPYEPHQENSNQKYKLNVKFNSDHASDKSYTYFTPTFKVPIEVTNLEIYEDTRYKIDGNTIPGMRNLTSVRMVEDNPAANIIYKNAVFDFEGTDPALLSLVRNVGVAEGAFDRGDPENIPEVIYETNLGKRASFKIDYGWSYSSPFEFIEGEYLTKLKIKFPIIKTENILGQDIIMLKNGSGNWENEGNINLRTLPLDGSYLGDEAKTYGVKVAFSADNASSKLEDTGKSTKISGIQESVANASPTTTSWATPVGFQGGVVDASVNITNEIDKPIDGLPVNIKNPTFYVEIDNRYMLEPNSITLSGPGIESDYEYEASFMAKKTKSGNSVLKIQLLNYSVDANERTLTYLKYKINTYIGFKLRIKPTAEAVKNISVIKGAWTDYDEAIANKDYKVSDLVYGTTTKDADGVQEVKDKEMLYIPVTDTISEIIPITEMGIGNMGMTDSQLALNVDGYDNENFKQQLSIVSNVNTRTRDWILYIPIAKEGKTTKYMKSIEGGGSQVVDTEPSQYSMYLKKEVEIPGAPVGTKVEYTEDENPEYRLDGEDVGNYQENPTNINDVTMVKITIPVLEAKHKIYPILSYTIDGRKSEIGTQSAFGGAYYNFKFADESDYRYGELGTYSNSIQYNLKDYTIEGKVWEENSEPADALYSSDDLIKSGVKIKATDATGGKHEATTDTSGSYRLTIPTYGKVEVKVELPNKTEVEPEERYSLVKTGTGTNASKFDVSDQNVEYTLDKQNISYVNAGLWAERAVFITTKDMIIDKGGWQNVGINVFPTYENIIYLPTEDSDIATVDSTGKVSGIKVGKTKAKVQMSDGKGGTIEKSYNITVNPNAPTATLDDIMLFQGNDAYDEYAGVEILDEDGNIIDVRDTNLVTVDKSSVDSTKVGKQQIKYSVKYGEKSIDFIRNVYVHGRIKLEVPSDKIAKINTEVNVLDGARATYQHVETNGNIVDKKVNVTTLNETLTSPTVQKMEVTLHAEVNVAGVVDQISKKYFISFNETATISTVQDNITLKIGASRSDIKTAIGASAQMVSVDGVIDLTNKITWDALGSFDTSIPENTFEGKISVTDPESNEKIEKEIRIRISKKIEIKAPNEVNVVVGNHYDPLANVTIRDGDGNPVTVSNDMINHDVVMDANGNVTTIGNYDVVYEYRDAYGNYEKQTTVVKVHGPIEFSDINDINLIEKDGSKAVKGTVTSHYINSDGNKVEVEGTYDKEVLNNEIGKNTITFTAIHPKDGSLSFTQAQHIYIHGKVKITPPANQTVKVNTNINPLLGATATYKHVESNGDVLDQEVPVTSALHDPTTSAVPMVMEIPLSASVEVVPGLMNHATASYHVTFNGLPEIQAVNSTITVRVGATLEEMKQLISASASVMYGENNTPTDLSNSIDFSELQAIDTSVNKATYTIKLYVSDKDGATAEKEITINISDKGSINVPQVNIVVGTAFDPTKNVTVIDGLGNLIGTDYVKITGNVDTDKIGEYEVKYEYTDSLGNKLKATNTIYVHGDIEFEGPNRIDLIEEQVIYIPNLIKAYYIDSKGIKQEVDGAYDQSIDQSNVKKNYLSYIVNHPVLPSSQSPSAKRLNIYVHGKLKITPSKNQTVKVNTNINPTSGSKATYQHVKDDGSISDIDVLVTSTLPNPMTSDVPMVMNIPLDSSVEVVPGLTNHASSSYDVTFNGLPEIKVSSTSFNVRVDATSQEIKDILKASANVQLGNETMPSDLSDKIDFSELDAIDTSKVNTSKTFKLHVEDSDGATAEKEITIRISDRIVINLPNVNLVEDINHSGPAFDPKAGVQVSDGFGNPVNLDDVKITSLVNTAKRGNYDVIYEYQDSLGNKTREVNTIRVHGDIEFAGINQVNLLEDNISYVPNTISASYKDSGGNKVDVRGSYHQEVDQSVVGKHDVIYTTTHPINSANKTKSQAVYVHGKVKITPPNNQIVKVDTNFDPLEGASATYRHVEENGDVRDKDVPVTSALGNPVTSSVPTVMNVPLTASIEISKGLVNSSKESYQVIFNGYPEVTTSSSEITVRVGATLDEIKNILDAHASVHYGDEHEATDLSGNIDFSELEALDTRIEKAAYKAKLYVTDRDGAVAEKEITLKVSKGIIMNVPEVNIVEGTKFDPTENVTIFDGDGKPVDVKHVTIDASMVHTDQPGEYEVYYQYVDAYGNKESVTNTIKVSGKLEFAQLDRVDVFEGASVKKDAMYIPHTAKVSYVDSKGKRQEVKGTYDRFVALDNVAKNVVTFEAVHPINGVIEKKKQSIYVHGKINIDTSESMLVSKVGTTLDPSKGVKANYRHVNDDGSIHMKAVDVYAPNGTIQATSPSYMDAKIRADVDVHGAKNTSIKTITFAFNGYAYIDAISSIQFEEGSLNKQELMQSFKATASMKKADKSNVNLTQAIDYSDVERINFNRSGTYKIELRVMDEDGVTSYKEVIVEILNKIHPISPVYPPGTVVPSPETPKDKVEEEKKGSITIITKDIPKSAIEKGISDELLKSMISVYDENKSKLDFDIVSSDVKAKEGTYQITLRLPDGTMKTVRIQVIDDLNKDVQKPGFGREDECFTQWLLLVLLIGYGGYAFVVIKKKQKDIKDIRKSSKN